MLKTYVLKIKDMTPYEDNNNHLFSMIDQIIELENIRRKGVVSLCVNKCWQKGCNAITFLPTVSKWLLA